MLDPYESLSAIDSPDRGGGGDPYAALGQVDSNGSGEDPYAALGQVEQRPAGRQVSLTPETDKAAEEWKAWENDPDWYHKWISGGMPSPPWLKKIEEPLRQMLGQPLIHPLSDQEVRTIVAAQQGKRPEEIEQPTIPQWFEDTGLPGAARTAASFTSPGVIAAGVLTAAQPQTAPFTAPFFLAPMVQRETELIPKQFAGTATTQEQAESAVNIATLGAAALHPFMPEVVPETRTYSPVEFEHRFGIPEPMRLDKVPGPPIQDPGFMLPRPELGPIPAAEFPTVPQVEGPAPEPQPPAALRVVEGAQAFPGIRTAVDRFNALAEEGDFLGRERQRMVEAGLPVPRMMDDRIAQVNAAIAAGPEMPERRFVANLPGEEPPPVPERRFVAQIEQPRPAEEVRRAAAELRQFQQAVGGGEPYAIRRGNAQVQAPPVTFGLEERAPGQRPATGDRYNVERAQEGAAPGGPVPRARPEALSPDEFQRAAAGPGPLAEAARAAGGWREAAYDALHAARAQTKPLNAELWDRVNMEPPPGYERKGPNYQPQEINKFGKNLKAKLEKKQPPGVGNIFMDMWRPEIVEFGKRIYKAGMDFARWAGEMIRHLGSTVRDHLRGIWNDMQKLYAVAPGFRPKMGVPEPLGRFSGKFENPAGVERGIKEGEIPTIGAFHIAHGATRFDTWSRRMLRDVGPSVRPYLKEVFARSVQTHRENAVDAAWGLAAQHLTPEQKASVKGKYIKQVADIFHDFKPEMTIQDALEGGFLKGWYKKFHGFITDLMGSDTQRFGKVFGTFGANTPPLENAIRALDVMAKWIERGRPTSRAAIDRILEDSIITAAGKEKGMTAEDILAWRNNVTRALQAKDPAQLRLSGPKVDPYSSNILGNLDRATLDRHMGIPYALQRGLNLEDAIGQASAIFGQRTPKALRDKIGAVGIQGFPGMAYEAHLREAAKELSVRSGEDWKAANMQETLWGKYQPLKILANEMKVPIDQLLSGKLEYSPQRLSELQRDILPENILEHPDVKAKIEAFRKARAGEEAAGGGGPPGGPKAGGFSERAKRLRASAGERGYTTLIPDVLEFGRGLYRRGMDFAQWAGDMLHYLGDRVRQHLVGVWNDMNKMYAVAPGFRPKMGQPPPERPGFKEERPGFRTEQPQPGGGGLPPDLHDSGESQAPLNQDPIAPGTAILSKIGKVLRQFGDAITVSPIPKLTRAGSDAAAYEHASARNSVVHTVRDLAAKVFPNQYKDTAAMKVTGDILTKDNILGLFDEVAAKLHDPDLTPQGRAALEKRLQAIDQAHDLTAYDRDVKAALNDPVISGNIARWKNIVNPVMDEMYGELRRADPGQVFETRGRNFGARINLLPKDRGAELANFTDVTKTMPEPSVSNYTNPQIRRDRFARRAKGTGEYETDPNLILMNTIGGRWNEVTKLRFYNDLVARGNAIITGGERPAVMQLGGEDLKRMPIEMPETSKDGTPRTVKKSMWIKQSLVREAKNILNVDSHAPSNPVLRWITGVQLLQATDMIAHMKNIHTVVANSLGTSSAWQDAIRKFPFLATADTATRIFNITREVLSDTPEIRAEIADMARQGLIRPKYPSTGIQKITKGQALIHDVDTAARVVMNRFWDNLVDRGVVEDTPTGRRKFVQQIGEYNRRLMPVTIRFMRDAGLSPFIVAGRTFNSYSRKLLFGSPGFEAKTTGAAVAARMQMLSGLATATILPSIVNYFTTGQFGGRSGTPIGAIDTGMDNDKGQHRILDVLQLMGIRRGLRGIGAQAVIEGLREGQTFNKIGGKAIDDITSTAAHPWLGPGPSALYSTISGKRLDLRVGTWPYMAKQIKEGGLKQYAENFRVTLKQQNPAIYSLVAPLFSGEEDPANSALDYGKKFLGSVWKAPASALGWKAVPPGSAFEPHYIPQHPVGAGRARYQRPLRMRPQFATPHRHF